MLKRLKFKQPNQSLSDIERKMYIKEIKRLTEQRDEYAKKYEHALKYQKDYEELKNDYAEKRKKQDELVKYTGELIKVIERYRDGLVGGVK
ncbi:MAG: hypothetical protein IJ821_06050 [Lachnospiraceae bacterium]|nr:hypothetical protein [Lachnospiraceae bacterium]